MDDLYISKEQAEAILTKEMTTGGIPLDSITARCMFAATEDSRGGHNCKLGPTPLWDRELQLKGGRVLRSEFMGWVEALVESGHKFQRAGRRGQRNASMEHSYFSIKEFRAFAAEASGQVKLRWLALSGSVLNEADSAELQRILEGFFHKQNHNSVRKHGA